jgi:hypothetical protein
LPWNFLASSSSDRGCRAAAVDLDAGLEFLARAGGHAPDGGEGVRERRSAALVLDAAHQLTLSSIAVTSAGASPCARSRRAASTPAWVKWLHGYGLKTTRRSSSPCPCRGRRRPLAQQHGQIPAGVGLRGRHADASARQGQHRDVPLSAPCIARNKPLRCARPGGHACGLRQLPAATLGRSAVGPRLGISHR